MVAWLYTSSRVSYNVSAPERAWGWLFDVKGDRQTVRSWKSTATTLKSQAPSRQRRPARTWLEVTQEP